MSRQRDRAPKYCNGKKAYTSWQHARNDADQIYEKHRDRLEVFRCRVCQAWHVGNELRQVSTKPPRRPPEISYDD